METNHNYNLRKRKVGEEETRNPAIVQSLTKVIAAEKKEETRIESSSEESMTRVESTYEKKTPFRYFDGYACSLKRCSSPISETDDAVVVATDQRNLKKLKASVINWRNAKEHLHRSIKYLDSSSRS
jgi:hypothetical protein